MALVVTPEGEKSAKVQCDRCDALVIVPSRSAVVLRVMVQRAERRHWCA